MSDPQSPITAQDIDAVRENLEQTIAVVQELLALLRGINDSAV